MKELTERSEYIGRTTNRSNGIMVETKYVQTQDGKFKLVAWRLYTVPVCNWGDWYKVHGNQKKSIGGQELLRDTPPHADCELTAEQIERAKYRYRQDCVRQGLNSGI